MVAPVELAEILSNRVVQRQDKDHVHIFLENCHIFACKFIFYRTQLLPIVENLLR